ncbi:MAG: hypothetical protein OER56_05645, partial [Hyphomicrobiales bacterium]|nr:hypothetical protein [Hyphomicrobiales bacterium]
MKIFSALFASLAICLSAIAPAKAAEVDLTMVMIPGPGSIYQETVLQVPEVVSKATGGRVNITINNSLVKGTQLAPSVRDGRAQMSAVLHPYLSSGDPRMGLP